MWKLDDCRLPVLLADPTLRDMEGKVVLFSPLLWALFLEAVVNRRERYSHARFCCLFVLQLVRWFVIDRDVLSWCCRNVVVLLNILVVLRVSVGSVPYCYLECNVSPLAVPRRKSSQCRAMDIINGVMVFVLLGAASAPPWPIRTIDIRFPPADGGPECLGIK